MCSEEETLQQIISACLCKRCLAVYERKAENREEIAPDDFCNKCSSAIEKELELKN